MTRRGGGGGGAVLTLLGVPFGGNLLRSKLGIASFLAKHITSGMCKNLISLL